MRSKKALLNMSANLIETVVSIVCGLILPRLILVQFGSKYYALATSVTQFLSFAFLIRSGVGGATTAALYRPLAEGNKDKINRIIKATDLYMKKIGIIIGLVILAMAVIYPLFVIDDFKWGFSASLFLIMGFSTFAENFWGIVYVILLDADQSAWVFCALRCICNIVNTLLSVVLIHKGCSFHVIKFGTTFVYALYPVILRIYAGKKYKIDKDVAPDNQALLQKWDAFWHQAAEFIMSNTDIVVLTVCSCIEEVSVYSVYALVVNSMKRGINAITYGLEAAFGNMIAKNEYGLLCKNLSLIEYLLYGASTVLYTATGMLIFDFIKIYTSGVHDVEYIRPGFAIVIIFASFFYGIKRPYEVLVRAAGQFRETKKGAAIEPVINITLSVLLVFRFGVVGVGIGTLVASIYRVLQFSFYVSRKIINRSMLQIWGRMAISVMESVICFAFVEWIHLNKADDLLHWCGNAFIVVGMCTCVVVVCSFVFCRKDLFYLKEKILIMCRLKKMEGK